EGKITADLSLPLVDCCSSPLTPMGSSGQSINPMAKFYSKQTCQRLESLLLQHTKSMESNLLLLLAAAQNGVEKKEMRMLPLPYLIKNEKFNKKYPLCYRSFDPLLVLPRKGREENGSITSKITENTR